MSSPEGSTVTFRRVPADVRPLAVSRFARRLQSEVANGRAFDCLVTGDAEMRRLNREYRRKDYTTDVLSFPVASRDRKRAASGRLGDIAVSLQRARSQARVFGHTTEQEIRVLLLHGVLHLMGLDHERDCGRMARAEREWRTRFGLPNGLIERTPA
jgi:probable rRNA maturation factor